MDSLFSTQEMNQPQYHSIAVAQIGCKGGKREKNCLKMDVIYDY